MRTLRPDPPTAAIEFDQLETHRQELTGYCYRMLASSFDAEDAVQETFVRAWRALDRFEDRFGVKPWLYRIATNVCLDMLKSRGRRALPMEIASVGAGGAGLGSALPETTWVQPIPDQLVTPPEGDPGEVVVRRESIRLAFIAALQHLPARQRAVLILRDVLSWRAHEVADLLDTSEDAVNSTLRRARSAIGEVDIDSVTPDDETVEQELLGRYVDAFESYNVAGLVALLHEDVVIAMPPFEFWLRGLSDAERFLASMEDGGGHDLVVPVAANGSPAVAVWRPDASGVPQPYGLMVLETAEQRIIRIFAFLDTTIFKAFGLTAPPDR